jgi:hypothetical protein
LIKKIQGEGSSDFAKALLFQKFTRLCFADFLIIDDKMSLFLIGTHENTVDWVGGAKKIRVARFRKRFERVATPKSLRTPDIVGSKPIQYLDRRNPKLELHKTLDIKMAKQILFQLSF